MGKVLKERYELLQQMQKGGFGITWLAVDLVLDMQVAVKEYINVDSEKQKSFFKEARKLAKYSNEPGIVNVRDYIEEDGRAYLVMEYLKGEDLSSRIKRAGTYTFSDAWKMMRPLMDTIERLHADGLIHRDISPDNIRILPNGMLKLLDFGSALDLGQDPDKTVTVAVKPGYAPYEQYLSREMQGSWTDVYGICAVLYKCITGITPADSLQRAFHDELAAPSTVGARISEQEEKILLQGLAIKPENRIRSVRELVQAVENVSGEPELHTIEAGNRKADEPVTEKAFGEKPKSTSEDRGEYRSAVTAESSGNKAVNRHAEAAKARQKEAPRRAAENVRHAAKDPEKENRKGKRKGKSRKRAIAVLAAVFLCVIAAVVGVKLVQSHDSSEKTTCNFEKEKVSTAQIKRAGRNKNLTTLYFYACELDTDVLQEIAKLQHVDTVSISMCTGFESLSPLAAMENLNRLSFDNMSYTDPVQTDLDAVFDVEFPNLQELTLDALCMQGDAKFLEHFPNLTELYLYTEGITSLKSLEKMPQLKRLAFGEKMDLSGKISDDLAACSNLEYLRADDTGLDSLNFAEKLENLEELYAANGAVTDLTPLKEHVNLQDLDLRNNQVQQLDPLAGCNGIYHLNLNDNQITSIDALADKEKLSWLYLNNNQIEDLSPLRNNVQMTTVEVNNNALTSLSGLEGSAERLTSLSAQNNRITDISALQECTEMHLLWLADNQIDDIAACGKMIELNSFKADNNQISDANALINCTELKDLRISGNQISDISFLSNHFAKLELLDISDNQVDSLKALTKCSALHVLLAGNNKLESLEGLEGKTELYGLMVSGNQIRSVEPIADSASVLLYGDFANNQITDVSLLAKLSGQQEYIFLENNRITDISMLPDTREYRHLSIYGNPIADVSAVGAVKNINISWDRLFIGYGESVDYTAVIESNYGKSMELRLVDWPLSEQGRILQQLKDVHWNVDPKFLTSEEADEELKAYRTKLKQELLGEEDEESDAENSGEENSDTASASDEQPSTEEVRAQSAQEDAGEAGE
ncbi:MAG: leucine-rich repeat domain-containing protein [Eubacteriales bacterium]|nr:leucine-rich repeat domain-containing protein [Eubacteriales bacterium]